MAARSRPRPRAETPESLERSQLAELMRYTGDYDSSILHNNITNTTLLAKSRAASPLWTLIKESKERIQRVQHKQSLFQVVRDQSQAARLRAEAGERPSTARAAASIAATREYHASVLDPADPLAAVRSDVRKRKKEREDAKKELKSRQRNLGRRRVTRLPDPSEIMARLRAIQPVDSDDSDAADSEAIDKLLQGDEDSIALVEGLTTKNPAHHRHQARLRSLSVDSRSRSRSRSRSKSYSRSRSRSRSRRPHHSRSRRRRHRHRSRGPGDKSSVRPATAPASGPRRAAHDSTTTLPTPPSTPGSWWSSSEAPTDNSDNPGSSEVYDSSTDDDWFDDSDDSDVERQARQRKEQALKDMKKKQERKHKVSTRFAAIQGVFDLGVPLSFSSGLPELSTRERGSVDITAAFRAVNSSTLRRTRVASAPPTRATYVRAQRVGGSPAGSGGGLGTDGNADGGDSRRGGIGGFRRVLQMTSDELPSSQGSGNMIPSLMEMLVKSRDGYLGGYVFPFEVKKSERPGEVEKPPNYPSVVSRLRARSAPARRMRMLTLAKETGHLPRDTPIADPTQESSSSSTASPALSRVSSAIALPVESLLNGFLAENKAPSARAQMQAGRAGRALLSRVRSNASVASGSLAVPGGMLRVASSKSISSRKSRSSLNPKPVMSPTTVSGNMLLKRAPSTIATMKAARAATGASPNPTLWEAAQGLTIAQVVKAATVMDKHSFKQTLQRGVTASSQQEVVLEEADRRMALASEQLKISAQARAAKERQLLEVAHAVQDVSTAADLQVVAPLEDIEDSDAFEARFESMFKEADVVTRERARSAPPQPGSVRPAPIPRSLNLRTRLKRKAEIKERLDAERKAREEERLRLEAAIAARKQEEEPEPEPKPGIGILDLIRMAKLKEEPLSEMGQAAMDKYRAAVSSLPPPGESRAKARRKLLAAVICLQRWFRRWKTGKLEAEAAAREAEERAAAAAAAAAAEEARLQSGRAQFEDHMASVNARLAVLGGSPVRVPEQVLVAMEITDAKQHARLAATSALQEAMSEAASQAEEVRRASAVTPLTDRLASRRMSTMSMMANARRRRSTLASLGSIGGMRDGTDSRSSPNARRSSMVSALHRGSLGEPDLSQDAMGQRFPPLFDLSKMEPQEGRPPSPDNDLSSDQPSERTSVLTTTVLRGSAALAAIGEVDDDEMEGTGLQPRSRTRVPRTRWKDASDLAGEPGTAKWRRASRTSSRTTARAAAQSAVAALESRGVRRLSRRSLR